MRHNRVHPDARREARAMKRILFAALALSLNFAYASAQETCESKAVSKDGRPLAGAAKASFLKKCKRDACQPNAVDKNGKRLVGAAKKSFMQKCEREAQQSPSWVYSCPVWPPPNSSGSSQLRLSPPRAVRDRVVHEATMGQWQP